ncbi:MULTISPECIES: LysR substrate-binding domain-containing protein [unclassified Microbulbifer]|uniref:LysR substrate-binding domain-containing protein n=1 Tax=unclassified Microbulbifer TaxID=2619833 RepID=UPI0027E45B39|nr:MULTISPECIES: LysR substrate-binding domain-containing protein [unclassified Microbulbifer]
MADHLTGISVFVEAVEAGSFSAAAERLHLSRSAVAKTIARLEERLGTRLFHRTTRSQSLTTEGQLYYEHCKQALQELRAGEALLESGRKTVSGRLRVSMPVLFGRYCVAPVLTELARRHPELALELSFSDRNVALIEDGFDLAVRSGRLAGEGLVSRRIARHRMSLCAAPAYLEERGTPDTLDDLRSHDRIVYQNAGRRRSWLFPRENDRPMEIEPEARLYFDDLEAIADAAATGMGLAWLPSWLIQPRLQTGTLVPVLEKVPPFTIDIHALWPQTPRLPYRIRVAIDALVEALPGYAATTI